MCVSGGGGGGGGGGRVGLNSKDHPSHHEYTSQKRFL